MNTRTLFLTTLVIAALALGAGLILADSHDAGDDETPAEKMEHREGRFMPGRGRGPRGFFGRGAMPFGRGAGMPGMGGNLAALLTEATGLEPAELRESLMGGGSLAGLIEANGGDPATFIEQATALASERLAAGIETMVHAERPSMEEMRGRRGWHWHDHADKDDMSDDEGDGADTEQA